MTGELITKPHPHFESHHQEADELVICMQHDGQCSVLVEIDANQEEQNVLSDNTQKALTMLDDFFGGRFAEVFAGLQIKIGDGLIGGGAEARPKENKILADRQKMLMSLKDSEELLRKYFELGDRTRVMSDEEAAAVGSAWVYELIHEVGHFLGDDKKRVDASESPTKYGRDPDEWHDNKDHEAFAEGFTHMVFGAEVTAAMKEAVEDTVKARLSSIEQASTGKNWGEL